MHNPQSHETLTPEEARAYSRKNNLLVYLFLVSLFIPEHNVLTFIMHRGEDSLCPLPKCLSLLLILTLISEIPPFKRRAPIKAVKTGIMVSTSW